MGNWKKAGKTVNEEGTTVRYELEGTALALESRKRHIPHANGVGTWDHTTYFVIVDGEAIKECYTLKDAKEYADALNR
ncbi:MAG: hypothetical protein II907_00015 [Firmicutes bacterium]|nr:hypothetical protein [Bacillota bacterium]